MKTARSLSLVAICAFLGVSAWAAIPDSDDHKTHHAQAATPAVRPKPQAASPSTATMDRMTQMDGQMKMMGELHQKMMNAKTPEERSAVMGEQMKAMQEGMSMMNMMGGTGMGGMQGGGVTPGSANERQMMLEKRMDMMQMMMQMMMDRVSPPMAQ